MNVRENVALKDYTTFKVGGNARYFVEVSSADELKEAVTFAKEKSVAFFVLGGGSNVLVADGGFPGVVIKNEIKGVEVKEMNMSIEMSVGAGENWDDVVRQSVERGFFGLENLSGIPGSVGAAPVQNIGAYGVEVKSVVSRVEALNSETLEMKVFNNAECQFRYRDSFFKKAEGRAFIITRVVFDLTKEGKVKTDYRDIAEYFKKKSGATSDATAAAAAPTPIPTLAELRAAVLAIRAAKLPNLQEFGTAGSFFKNPIIEKTHYESLLAKYPLLPSYPVLDDSGVLSETLVKVPLAWILDNVCNFKGLRVGDVGVYKNQALVLVNFGGATSDEVSALAAEMAAKVKAATDIVIEPEVQYVG